MRITGGSARGRRISCPSGPGVRPTADRVREALFQVIDANFNISWEGSIVLDLFAGSGILGIEALSRGAGKAVFVERQKSVAEHMSKGLQGCSFLARSRVFVIDVFHFLKRRKLWQHIAPFDLVFADPPYGRGLSDRMLRCLPGAGFLSANGLIVVEEGRDTMLDGHYLLGDKRVILEQKRQYGDTALFFYSVGGH